MNGRTVTKALIVVLVLVAGIVVYAQNKKTAAEPQTAKITINEKGFEPSSITLKANVPAKITFLRTTNDTCATAIAIPDYKIQKDIPLNKPVVVDLTPTKSGTVGFACG